jgi:pimeloyl-ACP methyl ester carboxylesterase
MVRQLGAGLLAGLLIGCGGGATTSPGTTAGASTPPSATAAPISAGPSPVATTESGTIIAFNGQLPLDDGRELRVRCIGSVGPPIILDGGGIDPSYDEWPDALIEGLATLATTCAYSRAGGTGSTPAERPRTLESMLSDHQQMVDQLVAMGVIEPPFVIAGHSLGATLAMAVAMSRLGQTAALVISDGGYPQDSREAYVAHCLYLGLDRAFCESAMEGDDEAIQIGIDAAALAKPVPDLPVAVISSREPGPDCDLDDCQRITDLEAAAMEEDWKALGPHVTFTRVDGDHDGMLYTSRAEIVEIFRSVIELAGGDTP